MTDFKLKVPIQNGATTITSVTLRRAKVKDIRAAEAARISGGDVEAGIAMLASACDLPAEVLDEMDTEDFTMLSEKLADFLPKAPVKTGKR